MVFMPQGRIEGGRELNRIVGNDEKYINPLVLKGKKLLIQILEYDYRFGNESVPPEYKSGWHGVYHITKHSNKAFFNNLVSKGKVIYEDS